MEVLVVALASCYMEGEVWEWFHNAEVLGLCTIVQESTIHGSSIQVLVIQESKKLAPTILMVLESNEVLRIQQHSKVQQINENLKIEEPLKTQEFE